MLPEEPLFTPPVDYGPEYTSNVFNTSPVDLAKGREFMKIEARRQESLDRIAEEYAAKEASIQAKQAEDTAKEEETQRLMQINLNLQEQAKTKKEEARLRREAKELEAQLEADRKERQSQDDKLAAAETDRKLKEAIVERNTKKALAKQQKEQASLIEADKQYVEEQERIIDQEFKKAKEEQARLKANLKADLQTATTKKRRDALNSDFKQMQEEVARRGEELAKRKKEMAALTLELETREAAKKEQMAMDELRAEQADLETKRTKLVSAIDKALSKKRTKKVEAELVRLEKEKRKNEEEYEATKAMMQARDAADKLSRDAQEREQRAYLEQLAAQAAAPTEIEAQMEYMETIAPQLRQESRDRSVSRETVLTRPKLKQRPRQMTLEDVTTDDPRITARLDSFDSLSDTTLENMSKFTESELEDQPIGEVADEQDALYKLNLQLDKVAIGLEKEKRKLAKAPRKASSKAERDRIRAEQAQGATYLTEKLIRDRAESRAMTDLIIEQNRAYEEEQKILAVEEKLSRERQQSLELELKQSLEQDVRASSEGRRKLTPIPARPLAERQRQRSVGEIKSELMKEDLKQGQIEIEKQKLIFEKEQRELEAEERAASPKRSLPPKKQRPDPGISLDPTKAEIEEARRIVAEADEKESEERIRLAREGLRSKSASRDERDSRRAAIDKLNKKAVQGSRERSASQERARLASEEIARRASSVGRSREVIDPSLLKRGITLDSDLRPFSLDPTKAEIAEARRMVAKADEKESEERMGRTRETLRSRSASRDERDRRRSEIDKLNRKAIQGSRERSESQERARVASEEIARRASSVGRSREVIDPRFKDRGTSIDSDLRPFSLDDPETRGSTEPRGATEPRPRPSTERLLPGRLSGRMTAFQAQQKAAAERVGSTFELAVASAPVRASKALADFEAEAKAKFLKQSRSTERYSQEEALADLESRRASNIGQVKGLSDQQKRYQVARIKSTLSAIKANKPIEEIRITERELYADLLDPTKAKATFRALRLTSDDQSLLNFRESDIVPSKGRGLKAKPKSWIEFGKYIINENMLDEGTLQVKTSKGSPIPGYSKKIALSDTLQGIIEDLLETGKLRGLSDLDDTERRYLETLLIKAGLAHGLGIKKVHQSDEDANKVKRFELVKGIYDAGNNSTEVIHELRSLILYFIKTKRLNRKDGLEALQELQ
jgi:hypothetical protein